MRTMEANSDSEEIVIVGRIPKFYRLSVCMGFEAHGARHESAD